MEINETQAVDNERPGGGYKIASIEPQRWSCRSCGDRIDIEADNEPGCSLGEPCLREPCHWHISGKDFQFYFLQSLQCAPLFCRHSFKCPGEYVSEGISCIRRQVAEVAALKRKIPVDVVILDEPSPRTTTRRPSFFRKTAVPEAKRQRCRAAAAEDLDATVIIGWKGWWAAEREEEDPEVQRLIDRRRQRKLEEIARQSVMELARECAKVEQHGDEAQCLQNETLACQEMALVIYGLDEAEEAKADSFEPVPLARKEQVLKCFSRRRKKQQQPIAAAVKQDTDCPTMEEDKSRATDAELIEGSARATNDEPLLLAAVPMTSCPICDKMFECDPNNPEDNSVFNTHVDTCLNGGFE